MLSQTGRFPPAGLLDQGGWQPALAITLLSTHLVKLYPGAGEQGAEG